MSNPNVRPSDRQTLLAVINPGSLGIGSISTPWLPAVDFFSFLASVLAGTLGAGGTIDAKLEQAQDDAGTGVKDITGKVITQITADNGRALINLHQSELDINNDYTHIRLTLSIGTAASAGAAEIWGLDARDEPGTHVAGVEVAA